MRRRPARCSSARSTAIDGYAFTYSGRNAFSSSTSRVSGMVTAGDSTRWRPTATVAAPRRLMWVGAPPPIAAILSRGTWGRIPQKALQRKNRARMPTQPARS
jgi:hypothetical protein